MRSAGNPKTGERLNSRRNMTDIEYLYVGGSMDGKTLRAPTQLVAGTLVRVPLSGNSSKAELYTLGPNDRFSFACYAWLPPHELRSATDVPAVVSEASSVTPASSAATAVVPILIQIEAQLEALDSLFESKELPE